MKELAPTKISVSLEESEKRGNDSGMTWFQAFRGDFGYSHYGDNRTSVTWDVSFAAIIYTCVLISLAAIIAAAGIRGKERWYTLVRLVYSLAVGSVILVSLFGYCWQSGEVGVHSPYIYRHQGQIQATVGIRIGLKAVNLTLTGKFNADGSKFEYNEELTLIDVLKDIPQIWGALDRGLPQPLLSIIEHFDIDAGGLRFGRASFMAGYFGNILLWTAFAFWVTANILLCSVIWYGAVCFTLTGICMVVAAVIYDYLCPDVSIRMPCSDSTLVLTYGWCFWSTLVFGCLTTIVGLILFTLDHKVPKQLAEFFLLDTFMDDQDDYRQIPTIITPNSQPPSTPHSPNTSLSFMNERGNSQRTPVNWYVNYGCDSPRSSKDNPVFTDILDTSFNRTESFDSGRPRAFSDITEEDDQNETNRGDDHHRSHSPIQSDRDSRLDRLNEIYVDVVPNNTRHTGSNEKREPYIKELDAMIDK